MLAMSKAPFHHTTIIYACTLMLGLAAAGCGERFDYSQTMPIEGAAWAYPDSLEFSFAIRDTGTIYDLYMDVQHTTDYPYQNIYYDIATRFPTGKRPKERISTDMADKTGRWLGNCSGTDCKLRIVLREGLRFNEAGQYTLTIGQCTRDESLRGIESVGLRLRKHIED
jgi:gliding motility-associated lipoprotein GldH